MTDCAGGGAGEDATDQVPRIMPYRALSAVNSVDTTKPANMLSRDSPALSLLSQ